MVFSKNFFTNNIYLFFSISVVLNIFKGLIPLILNTTEFNFFIFNFISLLPVLILISSIFLINLGLLIIWLFLNLYKNFNTTAIVFFITHGVLCLYFVVFEKIRISYKVIYKLFATISIFYSIYYIYEYLNLNVFPHEYFFRQVELSNKIFENFDFYTHTFSYLELDRSWRPVGLFDIHPHPSSYLYAMLNLFWLGSLLQQKSISKKFELLLFVITFFCLIISQVSSIITFYFLILIIFLIILLMSKKKKLFGYLFFFILIWFFLTFILYKYFGYNDIYAWLRRIKFSANGWRILVNGFEDIDNYKALILAFFTGHAQLFNISGIYQTEIAILKKLFEVGILNFVIMMMIFIQPIYKMLFGMKLAQNYSVFLVSLMFFGGQIHYGVSFKIELIGISILIFSYIKQQNEQKSS